MTAAHDETSTAPDAATAAFDELGRRAGEALRGPADPAALRRVIVRGRRQQTVRRVAAVGGAGALVVAVLAATTLVRDDADSPSDQPNPTASSTTTPSTSVPSTVTPIVAAGEPWIAQVRDSGDGFVIQLVRPDGTDWHPLPGLPAGGQDHPEWSPDGSQLALALTMDDGTTDLWVVGVDGTGAHAIVDCVAPCLSVDEPSWAADGRIAFQRTVETDTGIRSTVEVVHPDSTIDVVAEAPPTQVYLAPDWAPDGGSLVVEVIDVPEPDPEVEPAGGAIGIIDLAAPADGVRMITSPDRFGNNPDWSPNGDLIVFAERTLASSETTNLFTIRPDGSSRAAITQYADGNGSATFPAFQPDGQRIVYTFVTPSAQNAAMSVALDGSDRRPALTADSVGSQSVVRPI